MKYPFETKFFQKQNFNPRAIKKYNQAIIDDLRIADSSSEPRVIFEFSYSALIKMGMKIIALLGYKVKTREGHHIKIIEAMSKILNNQDIEIIGNKMRQKRNIGLYEGYAIIDKREADQCLNFIKETVRKVEKYLKS